MKKKISDKDKKDWNNFILKKDKLPNKDLYFKKDKTNNISKTIDLHGFSLEEANEIIEKLIEDCFEKGFSKIIVITGKGLRSNNEKNPYISKDLSILRYSVPEYIKTKMSLMTKIREIKEAEINDGGTGAFYILLKKLKNKF